MNIIAMVVFPEESLPENVTHYDADQLRAEQVVVVSNGCEWMGWITGAFLLKDDLDISKYIKLDDTPKP